MRKFSLFITLVAVLAGIIGFILRTRELKTVFDEVTGLAERGAPVSVALIGLSVVVAVVAVAIGLLVKKRYIVSESINMLAPPSNALLVVDAIIALLVLAGAIYYIINGNYMFGSMVGIVFTLFAVLAAVSYFMVPQRAMQGNSDGLTCLLSVMPAIFYSFWLIGAYRERASDPVLLDYCYECLTLCALALASYYQAGSVFSKPQPSASIATGLIAIYLCLVTLADAHAVPFKVLFTAACCAQISVTALIIFKLEKKVTFS